MDKFTTFAGALIADESGVTAIEYGLLAALIFVAALGAITTTGTSVATLFANWTAAVVAAL